jgi:hypothetical protein
MIIEKARTKIDDIYIYKITRSKKNKSNKDTILNRRANKRKKKCKGKQEKVARRRK